MKQGKQLLCTDEMDLVGCAVIAVRSVGTGSSPQQSVLYHM